MKIKKEHMDLLIIIAGIGYIILEPDLLPIVGWDDGIVGVVIGGKVMKKLEKYI